MTVEGTNGIWKKGEMHRKVLTNLNVCRSDGEKKKDGRNDACVCVCVHGMLCSVDSALLQYSMR